MGIAQHAVGRVSLSTAMRAATVMGLLIVPIAGFVALVRLDALATANASATGGLDLLYARLPVLWLITMAAVMGATIIGLFAFGWKRR